MASARVGGALFTPFSDLSKDEKKVEQLLGEINSEELVRIILAARVEYNLPWRRILVSRYSEIETKLKAMGYDAAAANPFVNLKTPKEIFAAMIENGGENSNSFNTIFMQFILHAFSDRIIEKRLEEERNIAKQKSELMRLEEQRLKEEEALVKLQLEKVERLQEIAGLNTKKSEKYEKLNKLNSKKIEMEETVAHLKSLVSEYEKEESEKKGKLEETQRAVEEKFAEFKEVSKKHAAVHIDFNCENFTTEQLMECRESARQGFQQTAAVINGKLIIKNELEAIKNKKLNEQEPQEEIETDEKRDWQRMKLMRKVRKADLKQLISERAKEITPQKLALIKEELQSKLCKIHAQQVIIKDLALKEEGCAATLHADAEPVVVREDYLSEKAPARQLEKKPVSKSFKSMKIQCGMKTNSEATKDAFHRLNLFFGNKAASQNPAEEADIKPVLRG